MANVVRASILAVSKQKPVKVGDDMLGIKAATTIYNHYKTLSYEQRKAFTAKAVSVKSALGMVTAAADDANVVRIVGGTLRAIQDVYPMDPEQRASVLKAIGKALLPIINGIVDGKYDTRLAASKSLTKDEALELAKNDGWEYWGHNPNAKPSERESWYRKGWHEGEDALAVEYGWNPRLGTRQAAAEISSKDLNNIVGLIRDNGQSHESLWNPKAVEKLVAGKRLVKDDKGYLRAADKKTHKKTSGISRKDLEALVDEAIEALGMNASIAALSDYVTEREDVNPDSLDAVLHEALNKWQHDPH